MYVVNKVISKQVYKEQCVVIKKQGVTDCNLFRSDGLLLRWMKMVESSTKIRLGKGKLLPIIKYFL